MAAQNVLLAIAVCLLVSSCHGLLNCKVLDYGANYQLQWEISSDGQTVFFNLSQAHPGWGGIGFAVNDTSTMGPADFNTGWVTQGGVPKLQDRYFFKATDGLPNLDPVQNLQDINVGITDEGAWWLSYSRKMDTGDPHDMNFLEHGHDFVLLHAFGNLPAGDNPSYHGPNRGKTLHVNLFAPSKCLPSACPNDCFTHGTCNQTTRTCECNAGWVGPDCALHDLSVIKLPPGFSISYFVSNITNARMITQSGANSSLFYVGSRTEGRVYALVDADGDGVVDKHVVITSQYTMPTGVGWSNGSLFVAAVDRILRYDNIDSTFADHPTPVEIVSNIPTANDDWHGWKFLRVHKGHVYFTVGSPCNYCLNQSTPGNPVTTLHNPWGSIVRVRPDGSDFTMLAHGIRDSQGFDFHPVTDEIWFTDNGRDQWGADRPWDELNRIPADTAPLFYGFPFCYGYGWNLTTGGPDPLFWNGTCAPFTGAALELGPHVAALGAEFYTGDQFPPEYKNALFIAEHGSWNRAPGTLTGYKLVVVFLDKTGTKVVKQQDFATGWLDTGRVNKWGRPVATYMLSDGSLLVSDDFSGAIYRITYKSS